MPLDIAMVIPPTLDLNTPYAAGPRLAAYLRRAGHRVHPIDVSLELFLKVYCRAGLTRIFAAVDPTRLATDHEDVYVNRDRYVEIIDDVVAFLQNRSVAPVSRIIRGGFLPEGPSFRTEAVLDSRSAHGRWGKVDLARYLATQMLFDLMYMIREAVCPHYMVNSYGEKLATSMISFDPMASELARPANVIEDMLAEIAADRFPADLDLACMTCPFPGNLLGSLALGRWLAAHRPRTVRALGGGYPSTELRHLQDARIFDHVDLIVLDDGEVALQQICARLEGEVAAPLHNTYQRVDGRVVFHGPAVPPIPFEDFPAPSYAGFPMDRYVHLIYRQSHISRLLSEGTWMKVTAAHGCYWKKCTFCDITLPYIADYEPLSATRLADHMDAMFAETGQSGFHFTDEACPPALLVALAIELLRRGRTYHWWGNIRYDKAFDPDRCRLLAAAGLITVTGGIEAPSDELLPVIAKGVTVQQLVKVLQAFTLANVRTHGYLIYGFPGETNQNVIDGLEVLRQLVRAGLLHSGYHHNLSVTAHSPLGKQPALFKIRLLKDDFAGFAKNDVRFDYEDGVTRHPMMFASLTRAMTAYDRRAHLDLPVTHWFRGIDLPATTVSPTFVADTMKTAHPGLRERGRACWLGGEPRWSRGLLTVRSERGYLVTREAPRALADLLERCHPRNWSGSGPPTANDLPVEWIAPFRQHGMVLV
jgi:radical SAM superfamily enzyme YgiQ (UPF0313 family)